ncbi:hypothetical protein EV215_0635 [Hypnocyclicus thermotrophus]|uniref:DUF3021 family protein n=1 Tax=Hypnocyclicus thermotrophus TaxID=1627895 RepID=A0AA46DZX5_9FUSO|nr:hypothetical protein [Hypnocyclicus thermotrophus]TDT71943.1 hypothetical protein EV215_0635 [Hypnocyclicus thermotrophus]
MNIKNYIINNLVSAFIGICIGGFYLLVLLSKYIVLKYLLISLGLSSLIGIFIGNVAMIIFWLFKKNILKKLWIAYLIESIVVMLLTAIFSYLMGVRGIIYILIMSFIAMIFANTFSYIHYRYFAKLNKKLKEYQEKIS